MANRGGAQTVTPGTANKTLSAGYYSGNITIAGDADLVAANIVSGKNIFGVAGSAITGKRTASGSYSITTTSSSFTITGLSFKPSTVMIKIVDEYYVNTEKHYICQSHTGTSTMYFCILHGQSSSTSYVTIQSVVTFNSDGFTCKVPNNTTLNAGYATVYYFAVE